MGLGIWRDLALYTISEDNWQDHKLENRELPGSTAKATRCTSEIEYLSSSVGVLWPSGTPDTLNTEEKLPPKNFKQNKSVCLHCKQVCDNLLCHACLLKLCPIVCITELCRWRSPRDGRVTLSRNYSLLNENKRNEIKHSVNSDQAAFCQV